MEEGGEEGLYRCRVEVVVTRDSTGEGTCPHRVVSGKEMGKINSGNND